MYNFYYDVVVICFGVFLRVANQTSLPNVFIKRTDYLRLDMSQHKYYKRNMPNSIGESS